MGKEGIVLLFKFLTTRKAETTKEETELLIHCCIRFLFFNQDLMKLVLLIFKRKYPRVKARSLPANTLLDKLYFDINSVEFFRFNSFAKFVKSLLNSFIIFSEGNVRVIRSFLWLLNYML